jgi:putative ABC transport system permease protein
MSLIALQTPATLLNQALGEGSSATLGGDFKIERGLRSLTPDEIAALERMKAEGVIGGYTLIANGGRLIPFDGGGPIGPSMLRYQPLLQVERSGQTTQLSKTLGVDPAGYPVAGRATLADGGTLAAALADDHSAVVTADLANKLALGVGDTFRLIGQPGVAPTTLRVTGIVTSYPDNSSGTVMYSLQTARLMTGRDDVATSALVLDGANRTAQAQLKADGWNVATPEGQRNSDRGGATMVNILFKAAGMQGLIIGSFGVLNTLQVLLVRRKLEIAMLKTLGYRRRDLLALFGIETALLGVSGALLGGIAAIIPSMLVTTFFSRIAPFLVVWQFDPQLFASGMAAGIAATMAAGGFAIVRASEVRPVALLRGLPSARTSLQRLQLVSLLLMLLVVFSVISSVLLGSPLAGVGVIIATIVLMGGLSLVFSVLLTVVVRLPAFGGRMMGLAQNNLRRQKKRAISALIALFIGIFAIGLATSTIIGADQQNRAAQSEGNGNTLVVYDNRADEQVAAQLEQRGVHIDRTITETPITTQLSDGRPLLWASVLQGYDQQPPVSLSGAAWSSRPDGVYLPHAGMSLTNDQLKIGSTLTITTSDGQTHNIRVAGFYAQPFAMDVPAPTQGVVVGAALAQHLVGVPATTIVVGSASRAGADDVKAMLLHEFARSTFLTTSDINGRSQQFAGNLFWLALSIAGLALVAGGVLIANAVGLAMLERRREIGIFKAIGFGSEQVLRTILLEHGMLGLLGGSLGVAAVAGVVAYYNSAWPNSAITFQPPLALALIGIAVAITLGSAALVAWKPTRVRPLTVLRDE